MNLERLSELAALNAVGVLAADELQEFNELITSADAAAYDAVASLNNTAALLGVLQRTAQRPSAALKAKVLRQITGTKQTSTANPFYSIRSHEGEWKPSGVPGVRHKDLADEPRRGLSVKLYELAPGAHFPAHHHSGPEQCFVVTGDFHVQGDMLHAGDFHHAAAGSDHGESFTEGGCQLLVLVARDDYK